MKNRTWIWVAALVVAGIVGFAARVVAAPNTTPSGPAKLITVSGTATVSTTPDEVLVDFGVRTQAGSSADALAANAAKMQSVLTALAGAGIEQKDIQTVRMQVNQQKLDRGTKNERTVYVAQNTVEVTIRDLSNAGSVIDAAVAAGADQVQDIRFQVSNPTDVHTQALQEAVRGARTKADAMAAAAGARVTGVVSIKEQGNEYPRSYNESFGALALAAPTPIVPPHEIETSVTVTVVWSLAVV
jgi:uncharacterized protein YggE